MISSRLRQRQRLCVRHAGAAGVDAAAAGVGEATGVAVNVGNGVRVGIGVGDSSAPPNKPQPANSVAASAVMIKIAILGDALLGANFCCDKAISTYL